MSTVDEKLQELAWDLGYNAALEWAANWITGAQMEGNSLEVVKFAKNMAMSIRAATHNIHIVQENFFDAVRDDPDMTPEQKNYWLSKAVKQ